MSATDRAKVEERVCKLLAQAADRSTTSDEAATFAARAAELIARYDLDEAVIRAEAGEDPEGVGLLRFEVSGRGGHGRYRVQALAYIAGAYGGLVVSEGNDSGPQDRTMLIVGTASALEALKLLLPAFVLQMEQAGARDARRAVAHLRQGARAAARRRFFRSFLVGWGWSVRERIKQARGQIAEEVQGTTGALVLVTDADRVRAEFQRRFSDVGKARSLGPLSSEGAQAGAAAGERADLGTGQLGSGGA
jgi:hypothetical protein